MNEPNASKMVFFVIVVLFSLIAAGSMVALQFQPTQKTVKLKISAESPCYDLVNVSTEHQPIDIYNAMVQYNCLPSTQEPQ